MLYQQSIVKKASENVLKVNEQDEIEKTEFDSVIEDMIIDLSENYAVIQKSIFGCGEYLCCVIDYCDKSDVSKLNIAPPRLAMPKM